MKHTARMVRAESCFVGVGTVIVLWMIIIVFVYEVTLFRATTFAAVYTTRTGVLQKIMFVQHHGMLLVTILRKKCMHYALFPLDMP